MRDSNYKNISFNKLNKLFKNLSDETLTPELFKTMYDHDPEIQSLVSNFNKDAIVIKSPDETDLAVQDQENSGENTVSQMAKHATDLSN